MDTPTMERRSPRTHRHAGFTITELLVVIAVIAVIVAILVPTLSKVRAKARTMKCLTNQRQITLANYAYTGDNAGRWVSPRTDSFGNTYANGQNRPNTTQHCWVKAEGANVTGAFEKVSALEQGTLWTYLNSVQTYLSPDEPSNAYGQLTTDAFTRVRSYSFNACLGVTRPDELTDYDNAFMNPLTGTAGATTVPLSTYNTTTVARVMQPARMMSTLVEDDNVAWNNEGWIINPQPSSRLWVDLPAPWRPDAVTLTYVDGSTDSHEMANPDICTVNYGAPFPAGMIVGGPGPHNARAPTDASGTDIDWKWFRDRLNPGILPSIPGYSVYSE